jgi:flagella basal body P-ring formation protein FlgA
MKDITMNKAVGAYKKYSIAIIAVIVSAFILTPSSMISASSWSPEIVLKVFMEEHYPWEDIEINNIEVLGNVSDEAPESVIVERGPIGKALFSFMFKPDKKVFVKADIRAFDRVVKSKRPYRKSHVIRANEVYIEKMDTRKIPNNAVRDPETIIGKSLRRSIVANIPISESMVEQSQVVKRGKMVVLIINQEGFRITTAGKIKEKGYVGSQVKAVNLSSHKEVMGVLLDEHTVEVLL